ncbi:hypothetical protein B0I72DRAFT_157584 [Yarrowia lipolytica]|nr:hypothetical protein B0I72DRAFT_157584 [Yarrowia lipolytica]
MKKMIEHFQGIIAVQKLLQENNEFNQKWREYIWTLLNIHAWASKMLSSPSLDLQEKAESQRLQARIYELLEDHEASLRRSVWLEADNFSRHLDRKEPKSAVPLELVRRFPWINPEEEMKTWGGCYYKLKPVKGVTALWLNHGENLPSDCEGFDDHREFNYSFSCDLFHAENLPQGAIQIKGVSKSKKAMVISFKGIEFTLPEYQFFLERAAIVVNNEIIVIPTTHHNYASPRDQHHYKHPPHIDAISQVGNIHCLIPTFLDLDQPGKMFRRQDKITTLPDKAPDGLPHCLIPQNSQYLTEWTKSGGIRIVDLDSGFISDVETPDSYYNPGSDRSRVFLGYENGKFLVRFLSHYVVRGYIKSYWDLDSEDLDFEASEKEDDDEDYKDYGTGDHERPTFGLPNDYSDDDYDAYGPGDVAWALALICLYLI